MKSSVVYMTDFKTLPLKGRGKVRDIYDFEDRLLIVATDRVSAFDVVMASPIPDKGIVLTQLSNFWFDRTKEIIPNHVISVEVNAFPEVCGPYRDILGDRSMLVIKTDPLPVECVVRGYLSGSGWQEYRETGGVCGIPLPKGLVESSKLDEPIFTPATKAKIGYHDENITFAHMERMLGKELAARLKQISLEIYREAQEFAEKRGLIIADTKMEFGKKDGKVLLIDELLTPDSSRFWPKNEYQPGRPQRSYDKQFLRDYLLSTGWNKTPPGPKLPEDVIRMTRQKYLEAYEKLTERALSINGTTALSKK